MGQICAWAWPAGRIRGERAYPRIARIKLFLWFVQQGSTMGEPDIHTHYMIRCSDVKAGCADAPAD